MPQLVLRLSTLADAMACGAADRVRPPRLATGPTPLSRWSTAVAASRDACLVVDPEGRIASLSVAAADLLGCAGAGVIGRPLLDVVPLVDFESGDRHPEYSRRIPTLGVLSSQGLMRGLMRVDRGDGQRLTLDAIAAPIHDAASSVVGSVTFLSRISPS